MSKGIALFFCGFSLWVNGVLKCLFVRLSDGSAEMSEKHFGIYLAKGEDVSDNARSPYGK